MHIVLLDDNDKSENLFGIKITETVHRYAHFRLRIGKTIQEKYKSVLQSICVALINVDKWMFLFRAIYYNIYNHRAAIKHLNSIASDNRWVGALSHNLTFQCNQL